MKFGILTFHSIPNIGAILQAQSLCLYIRGLGYDCDIIDYMCENIIQRELIFHPSSNVILNVLQKMTWRKNLRKIASCNEYILQLGILSKKKYDHSNISESNSVYDAFISGSDMIWNLDVTGGDKTYMADFVEEAKPRISYASSIGGTWSTEEEKDVYSLLSRYKSLSVREKDTNDLLLNMGLSSTHVSDPTLLVEHDIWEHQAADTKYKDYVLVYFPSRELIKKAKEYAANNSKRVLVINQGFPSFGVTKVFPNNPPEWLGLFKNADAIFSNSYHGLLFALYFNKKVWTANYGNRITSLLDSMNLWMCRVDMDPTLNNIINFSACNKVMASLRNESQKYLIEALKSCDIENS